jgi:predicted phage terminase large subunit-like protein
MQVIDKQLFIVDYLFNNLNADVTIQQCADLLNKYNVNYCRVESNSMGAMFGRNLQKLVKTKILPIHNTTNKITRILMQSGFIIERFNFVKYDKKDFYEFMSNVYSFSKEGKNKNDDAPDCLAGLSMFVQSMFKNLV